jgi:hypothetical protein
LIVIIKIITSPNKRVKSKSLVPNTYLAIGRDNLESPEERRLIDEALAELIADDVIEESDPPWASPAILVRQKGNDRFLYGISVAGQ